MDIIIADNADQAKDILINKFPHEEKGIQKYFASIFKIRDQLSRRLSGKIYTQDRYRESPHPQDGRWTGLFPLA